MNNARLKMFSLEVSVLLGLLAAGCVAPDAVPGADQGAQSTSIQELWVRRFGDTTAHKSQHVHDVAVAGNGDLFVSLDFEGALEVDKIMPLEASDAMNGARDIALLKLSVKGDAAWGKGFANPFKQACSSLAVDKDGNVIFAGGSAASIAEMDPQMSAGSLDVFVAKLDPQGKPIWSFLFGDSAPQFVSDVAVDAQGNVILVGVAEGTFTLGTTPMQPVTNSDIFVAKLDTTGKPLWGRRVGRAASANPDDGELLPKVAVTPDGEIVVAGTMGDTLTFDGNLALTRRGLRDAFIAKLSAGGEPIWAKSFGASMLKQIGGSVAINASGEILFTGSIQGTLDLGGGPLEGRSDTDLFLLKLDKGGKHLWSRRIGSVGEQVARGAAFNAQGDAVIVGDFKGAIEIGAEDTVFNAGAQSQSWDVFVMRVDAAGKPVWAKAYGDTEDQRATTMLLGAQGNVIVGGWFKGALPFAGLENKSTNYDDGFLFKLTP